jgi:hypothetical protein
MTAVAEASASHVIEREHASGCFRVVNSVGKASPLPASRLSGWDVETALDVEMVSAACPRCRILVVEASSADMSDLAVAEDTPPGWARTSSPTATVPGRTAT